MLTETILTPIAQVQAMIAQYIYEHTGFAVVVLLPKNPKEIALFEQAANVAMTHYGI